ncbi:hypothetical protein D3C85_1133760 [compost metagenome]
MKIRHWTWFTTNRKWMAHSRRLQHGSTLRKLTQPYFKRPTRIRQARLILGKSSMHWLLISGPYRLLTQSLIVICGVIKNNLMRKKRRDLICLWGKLNAAVVILRHFLMAHQLPFSLKVKQRFWGYLQAPIP